MNRIPKNIRDKYEFLDYGHALDILTSSCKTEWSDILACLDDFSLCVADIKTAGGNKSPIPAKFDNFLFPRGWTETKITADLLVKKMDRNKRTSVGGKFEADHEEEIKVEGYIDGHNVDFIKGKVAFDLEWNSKDQTFDRDLLAMRNYYDARIIEVGIIITRSETLNEVFSMLGKDIKSKYGASTTWLGKLKPRLDARRNGGCPVLAIGITKECLDDYKRLRAYCERLSEGSRGEEV